MSTPPQQLDFNTVNVFTLQPYKGNPLAIIRIPHGIIVTQDQKQRIAREFNLSESTFLHEHGPLTQGDVWKVDIFSTSAELPFAGHPTIGTACYVLSRAAQERNFRDGVMEASFELRAGLVLLRYDVAKKTAKAAVPHDIHTHAIRWTRDDLFKIQPQLEKAHRQSKTKVDSDFPIVSIVRKMTFVLVELESLEALDLVSLPGQSLKVTGLDKGWEVTFIGMYFFVRAVQSPGTAVALQTRMIEGTLEDPASGSAALDLAAYLSGKQGKAGETLTYEIVQGVEMGRRSHILVDVEMDDDRCVSRMFLGGGTVGVMEGRLIM